MTHAGNVRLARSILFIDYEAYIEVVDTASGRTWKVNHTTASRLQTFASFHIPQSDLQVWIERGVLVRPYGDGLLKETAQLTEQELALAWREWYWAREVETERDYRWLGHVIQKMPDDLFLYQEILWMTRASSVLELGYGRGGGLYFFASILGLLGGGHLVGVDHEPYDPLPPISRYPDVRLSVVHGDAHATETMTAVCTVCDEFDLVVIDSSADATEQLSLLRMWCTLVRPSGIIVVEDSSAPATSAGDPTPLIDDFLLSHKEFAPYLPARRFTFAKSAGAVFIRANG